ncbi:MAG: ribokinase [Candidatus Limnocylindrales bacterium]
MVVGSVNIDLVVRLAKLPAAGETVTGGNFAQHHGGKGANQAVAAARVGAHVLFVGAVGNDEFGRAAVEELRREGIDTSGVATMDGVATGVALIVVGESGENQIAVSSGANALIGADAVDRTFKDHGGGTGDVYLSNFEVADDAIVAGAQAAAERGMTVVINPAPARELPSGLIAARPILVPNEGEAQQLTGETDPYAAARILAARTGAPVVVTLGEQGAIAVSGGDSERISAPLIEAVDTTGAGDAFAGALAAELSAGRALVEAVRFAVVAASLSVRVAGAREGMPARAEVEAFLAGTL